MKKAVILHGTNGSPQTNWFSWLKSVLGQHGYEVWVPDLPNNHTPNRHAYNDFLFSHDWDFTNNLIVGHSSGAVSILNLLSDERCPAISAGVLVGAWAHMEKTDLDREQFKDLFPEDGFDFTKLKTKTKQFVFVHGSDDPWCPISQARYLCQQLDGEIHVIEGGEHFSLMNNPKWHEFPQLVDILKQKKII